MVLAEVAAGPVLTILLNSSSAATAKNLLLGSVLIHKAILSCISG